MKGGSEQPPSSPELPTAGRVSRGGDVEWASVLARAVPGTSGAERASVLARAATGTAGAQSSFFGRSSTAGPEMTSPS